MTGRPWVFLWDPEGGRNGRPLGDWIPPGPSWWERAEILASLRDLKPYEFIHIGPWPTLPPNPYDRRPESTESMSDDV